MYSKKEYRMVEINEVEWKKEKRIRTNEDNLRDLWGKSIFQTIESWASPKKKKSKGKVMRKYLIRE